MESFHLRKHKSSYHHGNLRWALLRLGEEQLAKMGCQDLSLREIAKLAGTSHAAAYKHFASREDLLAELACLGFDYLIQKLNSHSIVTQGVSKANLEEFSDFCAEYIRFSMERPGLFRSMFHNSLVPRSRFPKYDQNVSEACGLLYRALEQIDERLSLHLDISHATNVIWAALHGVSVLQMDQLFDYIKEGPAVDPVSLFVTMIYGILPPF
jgi:AcrR family transcriptional regulator